MLFIILAVFFENSAYAEFFSDVSNDSWYSAYASESYAKGWFSGDENNNFNPDEPTTRAQAAKIIFTALYGSNLPDSGGFSYSDVDSAAWYARYVNVNGIFNTIPAYGIYFEPDLYITRNDAVAAVMTSSGVSCSGADMSYLSRFSDMENVEEEYRDIMARAVEYGVIGGFEDGTLRPNAPVTRAQFAAFMSRAYSPLWTNGALDKNGSSYADDTSIISDYFYTTPCCVNVPDGSLISFDHYGTNTSESFTYSSENMSGEVFLPEGTYRIMMKRINESVIDEAAHSELSFNYFPTINKETPSQKIIAHRGCMNDAPQNTAPSFELAADRGYKYVECDVRWTSDNVPVLLHDKTIDSVSDGKGYINNLLFNQSRIFNYNRGFEDKYSNVELMSFEEFAELCSRRGLEPYVEIYDGENFNDERAAQLFEIAAMYGIKITWISSYYNALLCIKENCTTDGIRLLYVVAENDYSLKWKLARLKTTDNYVGLDCEYTYWDNNYVNFITSSGFEAEAWTVDDANAAQSLIDMGITGITTNSILP